MSQAPAVQPPTNGEVNGVNGSASSTERANSMPNRQGAGTPYSRLIGGKAAIPEWQRSAAKKNDEAKADSASGAATPVQNVTESGTASEAADGQA